MKILKENYTNARQISAHLYVLDPDMYNVYLHSDLDPNFIIQIRTLGMFCRRLEASRIINHPYHLRIPVIRDSKDSGLHNGGRGLGPPENPLPDEPLEGGLQATQRAAGVPHQGHHFLQYEELTSRDCVA